MSAGSCNLNLPRFERLAQGLQYSPLELGQLVEKQNTFGRLGNLTRGWWIASVVYNNC